VEERERLQQERLQTAARLTTMGELASCLAHELNQPLGAIASYLAGSQNMLRAGEADHAELLRVLGNASAQTQRAGQVIRRVHQFVRKQEPQRVEVDVGGLMEECWTLIELQAKRARVKVETRLEPGLPALRGDPVMLQQVILNLTRNGIEAMGEVPAARRRLAISAVRDDGGVRIGVRDFGVGILPKDAERIFSPFHTTKREGMGMGLPICRSIVEAHGGRLWFEVLGDGTVFNCWLGAST
jgi:two-component system sensor histidine kinase DctS